ncbi:MAG: energy-coupling factor transporter transmembrane protein EcfT [Firmicutes bacterium]|nr:energy-coupling factor transporter transmembrane protein EcfT [Bacillota bacterium]
MDGLFQADIENRGIVFDPRTKLFAMITICVFVIGGVGAEHTPWISRIAGFAPIVLLFTAKQPKKAFLYGAVYCILETVQAFFFVNVQGIWQSLLTITFMVLLRLMPGIIMGTYLLSTTTVSEFIAAMERMHIPNAVTIPMSVMFRLFPTITEEFGAINAAMKMRDIRIGGKNAAKIVEYRIVPLIVCSVNIGNELSQAALTRGLGAKTKRTNVCRIGFHIQDLVLAICFLLPYILLILMSAGVIE